MTSNEAMTLRNQARAAFDDRFAAIIGSDIDADDVITRIRGAIIDCLAIGDPLILVDEKMWQQLSPQKEICMHFQAETNEVALKQAGRLGHLCSIAVFTDAILPIEERYLLPNYFALAAQTKE